MYKSTETDKHPIGDAVCELFAESADRIVFFVTYSRLPAIEPLRATHADFVTRPWFRANPLLYEILA